MVHVLDHQLGVVEDFDDHAVGASPQLDRAGGRLQPGGV
jgi:hypothetical protein